MTSLKHKPVNVGPIKARALKRGDRVGLICPASRPDSPAVVSRCQRIVAEMGLTAVVGDNALKIHGSMAGTDAERLFDLHKFFADDSIAGIFCLTGGYGSARLLGNLDFDLIGAHPKALVGSGDNTALLNGISARVGLVTFHGPNLDEIKSKFTFEHFKASIMDKGIWPAICAADIASDLPWGPDIYTPVSGAAEGRLLGGNLTALLCLLGTPYEPDFTGSILFLEDRGEQAAVLDRWFTTLYIAGHLQATSAVACGYFEGCSPKQAYNMLPVEDTFGDRLKSLSKPSCFGLPAGQGRDTNLLPLGVKVRLDCQAARMEFVETALA